MRLGKVLVDTGPLVAYFNKKDRYHDWAIAQLAVINPPLLTCEAVLSEACFLLRHYERGAANVLELVERGLLTIPFRLENQLSAIKGLLLRYKNIPMSLADGCLVRIAEQNANSVILTTDSDFRIYRKNKRKIIPTIMPDDL